MGRKDKFTVDYFPHNCNHGKTIFILESRHGNNGYAIWFKTLELLGSSNNHFIDCRNTTDWEFMSAKMQVEPDRLQQIYDLLANLKAIDLDLWEHKVIWSQNFIDNLEDVYVRRINKCMNKEDLCKHLSIKCKQKSTSKKIYVSRKPQTKLDYTKLKETISKEALTYFENWIKYRKEIKKPITNESTYEILVKRFNSEPIEKIKWVVNHSIESKYIGLFWDKYKKQISELKVVSIEYICPNKHLETFDDDMVYFHTCKECNSPMELSRKIKK